jgi:hypothetical protein
MRKVMVVLLSICILIMSVPLPVGRADPTNTEDLKWMIVSKIKGYNSAFENKYEGQYGLLYNLYYLTLSTRWTELMTKAPSLEFSEAEKKIYRDELIQNYSEFNLRYSKDSTAAADEKFYYKALKLSVGTGGTSGFNKAVSQYLNSTVPDYLEEVLKTFRAEYDQAGADSEKFIADNKDNLRYIYSVLQVLTQEQAEMQAMLGTDSNTMDNDPTSVLTSSTAANSIISNSKYSELLDKGKQLSEEESVQVGNVDYDDSAVKSIQKLAWVEPKEGASVTDYEADAWKPTVGHGDGDNKFKLRDTYVAMIAATSVYKPFSSHAGDKEYLDALAYLTSGDATKSKKILNLYNQLKDYRKPLYVIEDAGWWDSVFGDASTDKASFPTYAGSGKRLTIKEFINRVDSEDVSGFVTHRGDFKQVGDDANSWGFYKENSVNWQQQQAQQQQQTQESNTAETATKTTETGEDATEDSATAKTTEAVQPSTTPTNLTAGEAVKPVVTMADEQVNSTDWTSSLFEFGYADGYPITGLALLKNFIKQNITAANIEHADSRSVFINAFGDIVADDNMIIIPAAANPMLYDETMGYNPYTVAFMNGYPSIYIPEGSKDLKLGSPQDEGKFLLMTEGESLDSKPIFINVQGDQNLSISHAKQSIAIYRDFVDVGQGKSPMLARSEAGIPGWWDRRAGMLNFYTDDMRAVVINSAVLPNKVPVFPYTTSQDTNRSLRNLIAYNMYWSYINSGNSESANFNGRLREDYIFRNILVEGLGGSIYASAYDRNMTESYTKMSDDEYNRFKRNFVKFSRDILESLGKVDGVLGIKNQYQDPILGKVMTVVRDYFWYVFVLLALILLVKFMRMRMTLLYMLIFSVFAATTIFLFIRVFPVYLPGVYNLAANNISKNLSYQVLATKAEKYATTYGKDGTIGPDGKLSISTTSLNLYKLSDKDLQTVADRYKLSVRELSSGKVTMLDSKNGIYLEGDTLKVNVDTLMANNPITGAYDPDQGTSRYVYTAQKMNSSVLDYYTPYYEVVDGFTGTLNKLLEVYNIPKHSTKYKDGLEKDSFVVYSYINSIPFLTPEDFSKANDGASPEELAKLKSVFQTPGDFLGLNEIISKPTPEVKETLWYQTLEQNGFLSNTQESKEKYRNLITDVNYQTKKFIIDFKPQVGMMSDENLIKIISIYATTILNQKASEYANWLYPFSLNYQEFTMKDVMLAAMTDDYSRFIAEDMDVATYVANETDIFTLLVFLLVLLFAFLIVLCTQFLVPVLYIGLGLLLIGRYVAGEKVWPALAGYIKVSLILLLCFTVFVWSLGASTYFNIYVVIYGLCIIFGLILFILSQIVSAIIFNWTEMGNSKINDKLKWLLDKVHLGEVVDNLKVKTTNIFNKNEEVVAVPQDQTNRYDLSISLSEMEDAAVDDEYIRRTLRRNRKPIRTETYVSASSEISKSDSGNDFTHGALEEDIKRYKN